MTRRVREEMIASQAAEKCKQAGAWERERRAARDARSERNSAAVLERFSREDSVGPSVIGCGRRRKREEKEGYVMMNSSKR